MKDLEFELIQAKKELELARKNKNLRMPGSIERYHNCIHRIKMIKRQIERSKFTQKENEKRYFS